MGTEHAGITRRHFLQVGAAAGAVGVLGGSAPWSRRAMAAGAQPAGAPGGAGALVSFDGTAMPFSFVYNGQPSASLLASWPPKTDQSDTSDPNVTRRTLTWTDPNTAGGRLRVTCQVGYYQDYPFTEWTVWFANIGTSDTAELSTVLALDSWVNRTATEQFLVHAFNGSSDSLTDFAPSEYYVEPSDSLRLFTSTGGRPTNGTVGSNPDSSLCYGGFPYYNVDLGDGSGFVLAIGWPGQWVTQFRRENQPLSMHLVAGMTSREWNSWGTGDHIESSGLVDTVLHAGEQIRTPLVVMQSWQAQDWIAAQNTWRRWMLAHNTPHIHGAPPAPMCPTGAVDGYISPSLIDAVSDELQFMAGYQAAGTTVAGSGVNATTSGGGLYNWWWMDAGWYDTRVNGTGSDTDWTQVGTWVPSPSRFPEGLAPVTSQARADGMKAIIWHEPERVRPGSWLAINHPEWLLGTGDPVLLNLGNSDAWNWAVATFDGLITSNGADCYRQDFNMDPLPYWNGADTPGRSGMTQIGHVMGYLAFWDQLLARHPGLLIDSCASGGRRNDLETLRRAVPLLRSDDHLEALPGQCHTWGLSLWMPCQGTGGNNDDYSARSSMLWCFASSADVRTATNSDWDLIRRHQAEWNLIAANFTGDYYPLTPYSANDDVWMAFQYDRGDLGSGHLQVFRRASERGSGTAQFPLRGLDTAATYKLVTHGVSAGSWTASDGFSSTQNLNNWHYEQRSITDGSYSDLTFSAGAWRSTEPAPWISANQCHAGYNYDAVRTWTAPSSGIVNITGAVYKWDTGGGNGIVVTVRLNDTVIWSKTVAAADGSGYRTDADLAAVAVNAGDKVRFIVNDDGEYSYDRTGWNPVIDYNTAVATQSGASLMAAGFSVTLPQAAGAVITYAKV